MADYDSLEYHLKYFSENDITDEKLYDYLAKTDRAKLRRLMSRLERVEAVNFPGGQGKKKFEGKKSRVKGMVYERVIRVLFESVKGFQSFKNISTQTNELDILIVFGPSAALTTPIKHWGTHCICECKNHGGRVKGDWLQKLRSVLHTHNAKVGLLFSKGGLAERSQLRTTIQIFAGQHPPRIILCFSWEDLVACAEGENFLSLLNRRYVELTANLRDLLLSDPDS